MPAEITRRRLQSLESWARFVASGRALLADIKAGCEEVLLLIESTRVAWADRDRLIADLEKVIIERTQEEANSARAFEALSRINDIRNSIIGLQRMDWSEHVYPLVAALNAAGFRGMDYLEARDHFGTMLERTLRAETAAEESGAEVGELLNEIEGLKFDYGRVRKELDECRQCHQRAKAAIGLLEELLEPVDQLQQNCADLRGALVMLRSRLWPGAPIEYTGQLVEDLRKVDAVLARTARKEP